MQRCITATNNTPRIPETTMRHCRQILLLLSALLVVPFAAPRAEEAVGAHSLFDFDHEAGAASREPALVLPGLFAANVRVSVRDGTFARDPQAALASLRAGVLADVVAMSWVPVRAGVSADRSHGFTFGYQRHERADGTERPAKYLAYWIRSGETWRMLAYRIVPAAPGDRERQDWRPFEPRSVAVVPARVAEHRISLAAAEQQFSNRAQVVGLGPAFAEFGRDDAVNLGGPGSPAFVRGAGAIATLVGQGEPATGSSVHWSADEAVEVASSGDLGVTFGFIRFHAADPGSALRNPIPFFTVWARPDPGKPWRYIAE